MTALPEIEADRNQQWIGVHDVRVAVASSGPDVVIGRGHSSPDTQRSSAAADHDYDIAAFLLRLAAEALSDAEKMRIAQENRIRAAADLPGWPGSPGALRWEASLEQMRALESTLEKELVRALRVHPLGPWVKRTSGIGEKQGARLLAVLGDPSWNTAEDRPRRGPAELWAYCGYVPGQRRRRGERANWSAEAKMRAYLVAVSCMKAPSSPYRAVYDAARAKHADAVHPEPCHRCGPAGHPAAAGSPLGLGHQHARALREVAKRVLRDLFVEAERLRA